MTKFEKANQRVQFYFHLMYRVQRIKNEKRRQKLFSHIITKYIIAIAECALEPFKTSEQPLNF